MRHFLGNGDLELCLQVNFLGGTLWGIKDISICITVEVTNTTLDHRLTTLASDSLQEIDACADVDCLNIHLFELGHSCRAHSGGNCLRQLSSCECVDGNINQRPSLSQIDGLPGWGSAQFSKLGRNKS